MQSLEGTAKHRNQSEVQCDTLRLPILFLKKVEVYKNSDFSNLYFVAS